MPRKLTRAEARRMAVRAQLLDTRQAPDILHIVDRLTALPVEPSVVFGPTPDLILWSRVGRGYDRNDLRVALDGRELWEHDGFYRPMDDLALFLAEMERSPTRESSRRWLDENADFQFDVVQLLADRGPLSAKEIPDTSRVPWPSSGWNNDKNVMMLLELLSRRGEVVVADRRRGVRVWDLPERVFPPTDPIPFDAAMAERRMRKLRSLGIARERGVAIPNDALRVGDTGVEVEVEGTTGTWRADPEALERLDEPFEGRTALLSPLDRLVFDRTRTEDLFEFEYALEMYKPAAKRRWGYFALPILHGDRLVGKLDAAADPSAGELVVRAIHQDDRFDAPTEDAVAREVADLAAWLRLDVRYE